MILPNPIKDEGFAKALGVLFWGYALASVGMLITGISMMTTVFLN